MSDFDIDIQNFDIPRLVTVYPDNIGWRWWTKSWWNGSENGEPAVEITRELAIRFMEGNVERDAWLEEYYPKQMEMYHQAIEQTREQLIKANLSNSL